MCTLRIYKVCSHAAYKFTASRCYLHSDSGLSDFPWVSCNGNFSLNIKLPSRFNFTIIFQMSTFLFNLLLFS